MPMCCRHRFFCYCSTGINRCFPAESNHSVIPFPRVSGKKSTKRTKSINGPLYVFRGRINTEVMEVENVEDGTGLCLPSSVTFWDCAYKYVSIHATLPEHWCNFPWVLGYFPCNCHVTHSLLICSLWYPSVCRRSHFAVLICFSVPQHFISQLRSWSIAFKKLVVVYKSGTCGQFRWSIIPLVSNRMQLTTSCITFWCQLFSNCFRCWYKSGVQKQPRARWQTMCSSSYCVKDKQLICGFVVIRPTLGSLCFCGLLRNMVLGLLSASVQTLCLPRSLFLSHVSFFFSFLCW